MRFGDPECQCLMARLESDLLKALMLAASGQLQDVRLEWSPESAICVIMAARGYPGSYKKNTPIKGLDVIVDAKVGFCSNAQVQSGSTFISLTMYHSSGSACFWVLNQSYCMYLMRAMEPLCAALDQ